MTRSSFLWIGVFMLVYGSLTFGQQFTPEDVLTRVLQTNPKLQSLQNLVHAREGAARQADVAPNPTVGGTGGNRAQLLSLGQELEYPGKRGARTSAALEEVEVARAELEAGRLEIEQEVADLYFRLLWAEKGVGLLSENVAVHRNLFDAAASKFREGFGSKLDIVKAQVEVARAQRLLRSAERDRLSDQNKLKTFLALRSSDTLLLKDILAQPLSVVSLNLDTLLSIALQSHPSILIEQHKIKAAEHRFQSADLSSKPNLDFDVSGGIEEGEGTVEVGVRIPLALWDTKAGAIAEAQYAQRSREASERDVRNRILQRVTSALESYRAAAQAARLFSDSLVIDAKQAAETARKAYETSGYRFLDLIDALRTSLDVNLEYYNSLLSLRQSEIELHISIGRSLQGISK